MEQARPYYKLLDQSKVGPPLPPLTTSLPLTFLDISLAGPIYARRQFFYHFPCPTHHFMSTTLPSLKHSLSIALQYFFPLAGNLLCPPPPHRPFINCTGDHAVDLTVVESTSDDFNLYSANSPKNLKGLDSLVPELSWSTVHEDINDSDPTFVFPIVALQVTVFPNAGFCIAITYCHVMDASSCIHFMKTWASICRSNGGDMTFLEKSPPSYDREVIKDPRGLEAVFLRDYFMERSTWKDNLVGKTSKSILRDDDDELYKATIVFGREDIEILRKWVMNQWGQNGESNAPKYLSKFVVTCGFVWTSYVKTRYRDESEEEDKDEYFRFGADCRNRLEYPLQKNYFGNCITRCRATLKRKEVKGEEGFLKAVKVIERAIEDLKKEPFKDAEKWKEDFEKTFVLGSTVLVTGSPKFTVYETDFGFGRPKKVEMVHGFKCMSLAESGSEEGGLEVGLVFKRDEYEHFMSVVERGLQTFKS